MKRSVFLNSRSQSVVYEESSADISLPLRQDLYDNNYETELIQVLENHDIGRLFEISRYAADHDYFNLYDGEVGNILCGFFVDAAQSVNINSEIMSKAAWAAIRVASYTNQASKILNFGSVITKLIIDNVEQDEIFLNLTHTLYNALQYVLPDKSEHSERNKLSQLKYQVIKSMNYNIFINQVTRSDRHAKAVFLLMGLVCRAQFDLPASFIKKLTSSVDDSVLYAQASFINSLYQDQSAAVEMNIIVHLMNTSRSRPHLLRFALETIGACGSAAKNQPTFFQQYALVQFEEYVTFCTETFKEFAQIPHAITYILQAMIHDDLYPCLEFTVQYAGSLDGDVSYNCQRVLSEQTNKGTVVPTLFLAQRVAVCARPYFDFVLQLIEFDVRCEDLFRECQWWEEYERAGDG